MNDLPDVNVLRDQLTGPLFVPGDPGYDDECATFNLNTPLAPAIAVGAATPDDVRNAVRFAAINGLAVAVRGGGHLQPRSGVGQLLLTLDRMNSVRIDPVRATARITGTPRWSQVTSAASEHGLAAMNGSSPTVGAIGYLLGGGMSPVLGRPFGYASDHILSIDVVTADGELRQVTGTSDPDLFFALRGSKGNLGVVTAVDLALQPVRTVYGGGLWFAGERLAEILPVWRDFAAALPDAATTSIAVQRLPAAPELPEPLRAAFVLHLRFAYVGPAAEGERLLAPLRVLGPVVLDTITDLPYADSGTIHHDPDLPLPYFDRSLGLRELSDGTLAALVELTGPGSDCPLVSAEIRALGGALDRPPAAPDAVPSRGLPFQFFAFGVGGPDEAQLMQGYLARCVDVLSPWAFPRRMVNFVSPEEALTPRSLREVYGAELYDRIVAVKEKYDPDNVFRNNHNIVRA
ncbi:FAD-binding oxidoreductase [Micromonospora ureilytica]|uniref:FAD-binding oxidoreductase n=1 Tax=Micromonospora ureilytica TaxID=709868 RepID=UPI0033F974F2